MEWSLLSTSPSSEWFKWRPDGSVRYAENPPKKYEDIVNVDFYAGQAIPDLWTALRDVVLFWLSEGVRIFRVDNPHTKPLPFWEWLIAQVRSRNPEVIFLSAPSTVTCTARASSSIHCVTAGVIRTGKGGRGTRPCCTKRTPACSAVSPASSANCQGLPRSASLPSS
jgi:glycosidase